jgi:hypothetical protein
LDSPTYINAQQTGKHNGISQDLTMPTSEYQVNSLEEVRLESNGSGEERDVTSCTGQKEEEDDMSQREMSPTAADRG